MRDLKYNTAQRDMMVELLLRGENSRAIGRRFGCDASFPPLRAYRMGLIRQRVSVVSDDDITPLGRVWLQSRTAQIPSP